MAMDLEGGLTGRQPTRLVGEAGWMVLVAGNQPTNKKEATRLSLGALGQRKRNMLNLAGVAVVRESRTLGQRRRNGLQFSKEDGRVEVTA